MRNLYARLILWLIRPALERGSTIKTTSLPTFEEISAKITGATLDMPAQCRATTDGPLYGAGLGEGFADRLSQVVQAEIVKLDREKRPSSLAAVRVGSLDERSSEAIELRWA